jgi:hypothetical protein
LEGIMMKKTTAFGLVVVVLVLAGLLFGAYTILGTPANPIQQNGSAIQLPGSAAQAPGQVGQPATQPSGSGIQGVQNAPQDIYIRALADRTYDKQEIDVKKGVPIRLHFTADPNAGCGRQMVVYGLDVKVLSKNGEEDVVEFTPQDAGAYEYNCGMRMWRPGRLVVS